MSPRQFSMIGAALLLSACGSRDDGRQATAADNGAAEANAAAGEQGMTVSAAADFAASVAASDLYEIESGRLAAQKASSPDIKSFAEMLVADHQKSTSDLTAAAGQANPPISVTPALDQEKQGMLDVLKGASEADFDRTFVDQQKLAHQKALELLKQYQASGDNQQLREFAGKASAVVQSHLDKLEGMTP